ncbi:helix-turn-helix domain-containing protein [Spirosoma spitsbergense]|uniref:helix-turn-helix domain-containing protein n=1 Tax=Spirosoma spitsbergense TaxID=431554 RepID=UPI001FE1B818|nr:helix-turn-helix domain-containing protein [Spirosoma spitsbergense]
MQQYIIRYRLRLVETKPGQDTVSISQIADEFSFTDVRHFNKLFKQYYHQTPTHYRHQPAITLNTQLRPLA